MAPRWKGSLAVAAWCVAVAAVAVSLFRSSGKWRSSARVRTVADYASLGSVEVISRQAPLAVLLEDVVSPHESEHIMRRARPHLQLAFVGMEADGGDGHRGRSNTAAWLNHDESVEVWSVVQKVAAIVGIPASHAEQMQVIRYEQGQECACPRHSCCMQATTTYVRMTGSPCLGWTDR